MIIAIHQPNYVPWLGYFHKIAVADVFVFLDNVQYSKNSYINRVRVAANGQQKWLTVPVSFHLGDAINATKPARPDWVGSHLATLRAYYGKAPAFRDTWDWLQTAYQEATVADGDLALLNRRLIESLSRYLGLECRFTAASEYDVGDRKGDDRLIALIDAISSGATYLSGRGGANYQDEEKFGASGISMRYSDFEHPAYDQQEDQFTPGLSVLDALFHLGRNKTAAIISHAW